MMAVITADIGVAVSLGIYGMSDESMYTTSSSTISMELDNEALGKVTLGLGWPC